MPWKKGQSGNPGGRPKVVHEARTKAQLHVKEMLDILIEVARKGEGVNGTGRASAAGKVLAIAGVPMNAPEPTDTQPSASAVPGSVGTKQLEDGLATKGELN